MIKPRGWQVDALEQFNSRRNKEFLLDATPGAGKTIFAALCARQMLQSKQVDFCLIVVPTVVLKGTESGGFLADWHKAGVQITTVLKDGMGYPSDFAGAVTTYQQLPNLILTIETWVAAGLRIATWIDEIHHASDQNQWGAAVARLATISKSVLAMTGTPFRGDGSKIAFINYDDDGNAIADFQYGYRRAVAEKVCRPVVFMTDDGIAEFNRNENEQKIRASEVETDEQLRDAARVIFSKQSDWLRLVLGRADDKLREYRTWDPDAGGLIICRSGMDENDDRHLKQVAELVHSITGERPEVISYEDPEANTKIDRFRADPSRKWICAVRKISEGVDIKRLRVCVMATYPSTELLFRQIVGRVLRVDDEKRPGDATVFIAKFPLLTKWAEEIAEQAKAGLKDQDVPKPRKPQDEPKSPSLFEIIGATHEYGGAISLHGETYSADEIHNAERMKFEQAELLDVSVTSIAMILRLAGVQVEPGEREKPPLQVQKKQIREQIVNLTNRIAFKSTSPGMKPDFKGVWTSLNARLGVQSIDDLMNNHTLDHMRKAKSLLDAWLVGEDVDA